MEEEEYVPDNDSMDRAVAGVAHTDALDDAERASKRIVELEKQLSDLKMDYRLLETALGAHSDEKLLFQGYLKKKTPSIVVGRDYDRRWFVLRGKSLLYFEEKGRITLDESTEIGFADKDPVAFTLKHPNSRKYELKCESHEERDRWMAVLAGTPLPTEASVDVDLQDLETQEEAERDMIEAHANNRMNFMNHWMQSERVTTEQRLNDLRKARDFAVQLLATDDKYNEAVAAAEDKQAELEGVIAGLRNDLAKEIQRKEKTKTEAAGRLGTTAETMLVAGYVARWMTWTGEQKKKQHEAYCNKIESEKFALQGRLTEAQDHGERFMEAHKTARKVITDMQQDIKRWEDQTFWLHYSNKYLYQELEERKNIIIRNLEADVASLENHRDKLQKELNETIADLLDTRERLRVKTNEAQQKDLSLEAADARYHIASDFHFEAFKLQADSVLSATRQTYGGRVQSSFSGWDKGGGKIWRDVYLWTDPEGGTLNYAHRDRKWGEVESLDLRKVLSVEVESFYEYPPPEGVGCCQASGFYIEMKDETKHRFCTATTVERSEWLDALRGLLLAVCYVSPRRMPIEGVEYGSPPVPRPAVQGASSWSAVEGGGSPRAAAATSLSPRSVRRTRAVITQPSTPGQYGHPSSDMSAEMQQIAAHSKVTVLPSGSPSPRRAYAKAPF
eukprot:TRINITY_DN3392_c0_g1_i1.p1 TRINITY_DN3392_c0_g1~~TRINITY_DN3392_c0_g1_i1.p1  ORF type:complete len:674 (+),score=163.14 TRINITY_DN3392_c0_g1_i1:1718-3739(+)